MSTLPPNQNLRCERCGHDRAEHYAVNLTDGAFIGKYVPICPTSIFKVKDHNEFGQPYVSTRTPQ